MTTLQQFIEENYNKDVEVINISSASAEIWDKLQNGDDDVKGKKVDLSAYTNLKKLALNTLGISSIRELTLHNPKLTTLIIRNNEGLDKLDIAGCSELTLLQLNEPDSIYLPYTFKNSTTKIVGWEDTKLYNGESEKERLQGILQTRLETEGEESWQRERIFESSDEGEETQEELIEVPPKKECRLL